MHTLFIIYFLTDNFHTHNIFCFHQAGQFCQLLESERNGRAKAEVLEEGSVDQSVRKQITMHCFLISHVSINAKIFLVSLSTI